MSKIRPVLLYLVSFGFGIIGTFITLYSIIGLLTEPFFAYLTVLGGINLFAAVYLLFLKPNSRLSALIISAVDVLIFGFISVDYLRVALNSPGGIGEVTYFFSTFAVVAFAITSFSIFSFIFLLLPQTKLLFRWQVKLEQD
ncbi:MAG TPA: hypothetical protein VE439_05035 [Anaerolineae bacterium]|nr:hypothetical protein [Anaerolineae bacterium]